MAVQATQPGPRLNLLVSYGGWRDESWADQLPRLLSPMGIRSWRVNTGREAEDMMRTHPVHIAVIDLAMPLADNPARPDPAGPRILQLLKRIEPAPPPTVVVRSSQQPDREHVRGLAAALREGAYTVIDHPVRVETILEVMRRIVRRFYADLWPVN